MHWKKSRPEIARIPINLVFLEFPHTPQEERSQITWSTYIILFRFWFYPRLAFTLFSFSLKIYFLVNVIAVVCSCVFHILGVFSCSLLLAFPFLLNNLCSLLQKKKKNLQDLKYIKASDFPHAMFPSVLKKRHFIVLGEPLKNLTCWASTCPVCWEVLTDKNGFPSYLALAKPVRS